MRISDWISDVCSSDLASGRRLYLLAKDLLWGAIVVRCLLWGVVGLAALSWSGFARAQERHVGTYSEIIVTGEKARSEEHTSELQSLMRISYAVFCLKKKKKKSKIITNQCATL